MDSIHKTYTETSPMNPFFKKLLRRSSLWTGATLLAVALPVAANPFPSRITIVVPASPGGLIDTSARLIGQKLAAYWGIPVIVENKAGGNLIIGTRAVAQGPTDGSMLLAGVESSIIVNPIFEKGTPYATSDFAVLGQVWDTSLMLVASAGVPAKSFAELSAHVNAHPQKLKYSSTGTQNELDARALTDATGWQFLNVRYKGNVERMQSLLSGETHFTLISTGYAAPMVTAGKLTGVFVTSAKRSSHLPNVPTSTEVGLKNFVMSSWGGLFVSSKVPAATRDKLRDGVQRALAEPDFQTFLAAAVVDPGEPDAETFAKRIQSDVVKWRAIANRHNIPTYR